MFSHGWFSADKHYLRLSNIFAARFAGLIAVVAGAGFDTAIFRHPGTLKAIALFRRAARALF